MVVVVGGVLVVVVHYEGQVKAVHSVGVVTQCWPGLTAAQPGLGSTQ